MGLLEGLPEKVSGEGCQRGYQRGLPEVVGREGCWKGLPERELLGGVARGGCLRGLPEGAARGGSQWGIGFHLGPFSGVWVTPLKG